MKTRGEKGFTLIELMVALGMALAITTAAMGVLMSAMKTQKEATMRAELARDSQFLIDTLSRDLAYLGAGVPRGFEGNFTGNLIASGVFVTNTTAAQLTTAAPDQLRPALRIGDDDYLAFLGDLPYPNADLNGIVGTGQMDALVDNSTDIAVQSELSPCAPPASAPGNYVCDTRTESYIQGVGGAACTQSSINQPTCPWGMNKWQADGGGFVPLVFSAVDGTWYRRRWNRATMAANGGRAQISLNAAQPAGTGGQLPTKGFVQSTVGGGMGAQLDRVFWSVRDSGGAAGCGTPPCTLLRRQCWGWNLAGAVDPASASFPVAGGAAIRPPTVPGDCTTDTQGTDWEEIAGDVEEFTLSFFGPADLPSSPLGTAISIASAANTRVIEVDFLMRRDIPGDANGRTMEQRTVRRFWLENAGGIVSWPEVATNASGGCNPDANYPNECNPQ
jgi:type II secretory pathway pseudopilin PulG